MIISGINTGIAVADLDESAKVYTDALGFAIKHRLETDACKIYVMENEYTEFDLVAGADFKAGCSSVRITVRNFEDSVADATNAGLEKISDVMDSERMKVVFFKDKNGTIFIISHHKKVNLYV